MRSWESDARVRDRRYLLSLAASASAAALMLTIIVLFVALAGFPGASAIVAVPAGFLYWFYRGPRPDLVPREGSRREGGRAGEVGGD